MQIADNKVVAFHYTLTNNAGQTIDSSHQRQEPLAYLHGHGNIIPGLEKALVGRFKKYRYQLSYYDVNSE